MFISSTSIGNIVALCGVLAALAFGFTLRTSSDEVFSPTSRKIAEWPAVLLILLGAISLRLFGIQFGLPSPLHPDEFQKAHFTWKMMVTDTIIPDGHLHPPLVLYASWFMSRIVQALGYFPDNTLARILLGGRLTSAILDTFSVYLVFLIGRRLKSPTTGLMAALLVAVNPLSITNARYMKEDAPFVFFLLLSVFFALRYADSKRLRELFLCGLAAGFSFGSKFTGLLSTSVVVSTLWLTEPEFRWLPPLKRLPHTFLALLLIPIGFAITAPYIIWEPKYIMAFVGGFESESRHATNGHYGLAIDPWSQWWMYHFRESVLPGIGLIATVLGLFGAGQALRKWNPKHLLIVGLLFLFYAAAEYVKSKPPPQPERYVLPCIPFLALLAAEACQYLGSLFSSLLKSKSRFTATILSQWSLAGIAALFPLLHSVEYASEIRYDTRKQSSDWLTENIPAGSRILTAGGSLYLPHIPQKFKSKSLRTKLGRQDSHIVSRLRETGWDYLVVSSFDNHKDIKIGDGPSEVHESMQAIATHFPLVREVRAKYGSYGFHNPTIKIYALKGTIPTQTAEQTASSANKSASPKL